MTDIVERLRGLVATCGCGACEDAADEIERLRAELERAPEDDWEARGFAAAMQGEIDTLRAELERLKAQLAESEA